MHVHAARAEGAALSARSACAQSITLFTRPSEPPPQPSPASASTLPGAPSWQAAPQVHLAPGAPPSTSGLKGSPVNEGGTALAGRPTCATCKDEERFGGGEVRTALAMPVWAHSKRYAQVAARRSPARCGPVGPSR